MTCVATRSNWTLWSFQVVWKFDALPVDAKYKSSAFDIWLPHCISPSTVKISLMGTMTSKNVQQLTSSFVFACHLQCSLYRHKMSNVSCICEHAVKIVWSCHQLVRLTISLLQGGGTGQPLAPETTVTNGIVQIGTNSILQKEIGLAPTPDDWQDLIAQPWQASWIVFHFS